MCVCTRKVRGLGGMGGNEWGVRAQPILPLAQESPATWEHGRAEPKGLGSRSLTKTFHRAGPNAVVFGHWIEECGQGY